MRTIVVDYGAGNVFSVLRALERAGAMATLTSDARLIENAERLILPGVGAFADGMKALEVRDLVPSIRAYIRHERPFLGICLGMQMLFSESDEFGASAGLGVLTGRVCRIPSQSVGGNLVKVPHIGWSTLTPGSSQSWDESALTGLPKDPAVYFVHSFHAVPDDSEIRLAKCDFHGHELTAAIQRGAIFGCQFHPEKSGPVGLKILENFLSF